MIYWLCHGLHSAVKKSRPDLNHETPIFLVLEASGLAIPTRQVFPCLLLQFVLPEPGWEPGPALSIWSAVVCAFTKGLRQPPKPLLPRGSVP